MAMLWLTQRQLKSKNAAFRRKAVEHLCHKPTPRALPVLSAALEDEDVQVRVLAATALGKLDDERRLELLFHALRDRNPEVQRAAILALKRTPGERVVAALAPLIRHAEASVRSAAAAALEQQGWHPEQTEDEIWWLAARGQLSRAAGYGTAAIPILEKVLDRGHYSLCVAAAQALGEIPDRRVLAPLIRALKLNDAAVCVAAVDSLGRLGFPEAIEPVTAVLRHPDPHVRLAATEALGGLGARQAVDPLKAALRDPLWDVRRAAAEALGRIQDPQALDPLIEALGDADSDVRETSAMALGRLRDRAAIGPLVGCLADPASGVRRIAAAVLSRLDENWASSPEARAAAEQLAPLLSGKDPDVRYFISKLLGTLPSLAAPLPAVREDPTPVTSEDKRRKLTVSFLLASLCDVDRDFRQASAEALGRLREPRAEPALVRALGDADTGVRLAAEWALQEVRTESRIGH